MRSTSRLFLVILAGILAVGLMTGCGGDDDNGSVGTSPQGQEPSQLQVAVPTALQGNNDPGAQMAVAFINQFNGLAEGFRGYFTPPTRATKDSGPRLASDDVWSWTQGSQTWVLTYQETSSNRQWTLKVNNVTLMEAYELKDGSYGYFFIYDLEDSSEIFRWEWETGPGNSIEWVMESGTARVTISVSGDGSGSINYYDGAQLSFECSWTSAGSGSWYDYSENQGGSWG